MNLSLMQRDSLCAELVAQELRQHPQSFKVLVADDTEFDRLLIGLGFFDSACFNVVGEVRDGEEAIRYLSGQREFADRTRYPFPDLLLLDLQMPRVNGLEVLQWIAGQHFPDLPVIMLSSSLSPAMVVKVMELGAQCYQEKQSRVRDAVEFVRRLEMYMVCRRKCPRFPVQWPHLGTSVPRGERTSGRI